MLLLSRNHRPSPAVLKPVFNLPKTALDSRDWLFDKALPLWSSNGFDHTKTAWQESLDESGKPTRENRRARVQGRQTWVFAMAGTMGWTGPWEQLVNAGIDGIQNNFCSKSGLLKTLVSASGKTLNSANLLYDQTFVILALAAARHSVAGARKRAGLIMDGIEDRFRNRSGLGFVENCIRYPYQSNAHMHLLEAAMAWAFANKIDGVIDPRWDNLAAEMVKLAKDRFIDRKGGFLREFFNPDWSPKHGDDGTIVEPGHQFEWAWLLARWAGYKGCTETMHSAVRLFNVGAIGIDPTHGAAVNTLNDRLEPVTREARLWPQTEWLKAALILYQNCEVHDRPHYLDHIEQAHTAMTSYLATNHPGLWYDKLLANNSFVQGVSPASSLYHIACAIDQMMATATYCEAGGLDVKTR